MNDLVEGCRIDGQILLDGQDIFHDIDVNLLRKKGRNGIPEAESVPDEHL